MFSSNLVPCAVRVPLGRPHEAAVDFLRCVWFWFTHQNLRSRADDPTELNVSSADGLGVSQAGTGCAHGAQRAAPARPRSPHTGTAQRDRVRRCGQATSRCACRPDPAIITRCRC